MHNGLHGKTISNISYNLLYFVCLPDCFVYQYKRPPTVNILGCKIMNDDMIGRGVFCHQIPSGILWPIFYYYFPHLIKLQAEKNKGKTQIYTPHTNTYGFSDKYTKLYTTVSIKKAIVCYKHVFCLLEFI